MATSSNPTPNNKVVHGARCVIMINGVPVGVFTSASFGVNYTHQPIYILGRLSAAEIAMTGMDVVTVQCHGWRVLNHGPFAGALTGTSSVGTAGSTGPAGNLPANGDPGTGDIGMARLQDLFTLNDTTIAIYDRTNGASGLPIMIVTQAKITSFQSQVNSRQAMDFSVTFVGLTYSDEAGNQAEPGIGLPA